MNLTILPKNASSNNIKSLKIYLTNLPKKTKTSPAHSGVSIFASSSLSFLMTQKVVRFSYFVNNYWSVDSFLPAACSQKSPVFSILERVSLRFGPPLKLWNR